MKELPAELMRGAAQLEQRAFKDGYGAAMTAVESAVYQGMDAVIALLHSVREEDAAPIRRPPDGGWASN